MTNKQTNPEADNDPWAMTPDNLWVVFFETSVGSQRLGSPSIKHAFDLCDPEGWKDVKIKDRSVVLGVSLRNFDRLVTEVIKLDPLKGTSSEKWPKWFAPKKELFAVWAEQNGATKPHLVQARGEEEAIAIALQHQLGEVKACGSFGDLRALLQESYDVFNHQQYEKIGRDYRKGAPLWGGEWDDDDENGKPYSYPRMRNIGWLDQKKMTPERLARIEAIDRKFEEENPSPPAE